jgi:hypothetical protein
VWVHVVRLAGAAELLLAFGVLVVSLIVAAALGARGRGAGAKRALLVAALVPPLHLVALAAAAAVVRERTLPLGEPKWFCDLDCDLNFAVARVTPDAVVPGLAPPAGTRWWAITVRAHSLAARVRMNLGGGYAEVVDERRRRYAPSAAAHTALARAGRDPGRLDVALDPGQSADVEVVFALPRDVRTPRLLVASGMWPSHVAAGDENAWFHGKTWFALT